ncbi:potassium channel family protein [Halovenus salina]|uniref:Potassium channel family protein n=1 Tax=Halovenus salina TaxID=1510225 RepID=A0ABD5W343_9EURY|nr:TrkA family potassium uptake protein [Halovenus salina]
MIDKKEIVIAGGGQMGLRTAQLLNDRGHKVTLIERDHGRCRYINNEYIGTVIEGDASRPNILRQTDPDRCDVLAAMTGDTATNLGICMAAAEMTDVTVVMRVSDPEATEEYSDLVDGIVYPEEPGARAVINELVGDGVRSVESVGGNLEILEVKITPNAPAAGRTLRNTSLPRGSLIIAHANGDRVSTADTTLEPGDRYLVAVEAAVNDEVMNLLRG